MVNVRFIENAKRNAILVGFNTLVKLGKTPYPNTVIWECTLRCNLDCRHCGAPKNSNLKELQKQEIIDLIAELAKKGTKRFLITGGEPLLRNDLFEILAEAKKVGLRTGISTNGFFVDERIAGKSAELVDSIQVSVDGINETHNAIRGNAFSFEKAVNSIKLFKKAGVKQVCLSSVITPLNFSQLNELYTLASEISDVWRVSTVMPIGKAAIDADLFLSKEKLRELLIFLKEKSKNKFPIFIGENLGFLGEFDAALHKNDFFYCGAGIVSCCIGADGKVRGCPELPSTKEFIQGDLVEKSFSEIWSNGFQEYREEKPQNLDKYCLNCKDWVLCRGGCRVMQLANIHCTPKLITKN